MDKSIKWITRSAASIALIIAVQAATAPLKQQLITGSLVNLILALSAMLFGWEVGAAAAVISPLIAYLLGINAQILVVPAIAAGNLVYVLMIFLIGKKLTDRTEKETLSRIISVIPAALCKFAVQYILIVKWIAPVFLPEKAQAVMSVNFGIIQLVTACIGGAAAGLIAGQVRRGVRAA